MLTNYLLTARQRLRLFCITQQPGLQLVDDNIHFSNPEHNPHNDKNTRVTVSYTSTYVDVPTRVLHYNRLDVAEFFSGMGELSLNISSAATTQQALDAILARYGVAVACILRSKT